MGKVHTVVVVLLVLPLTVLSPSGIADAQDVSPKANVEGRSGREIRDPCQDSSMPPALKEALRLVCSRPRVDSQHVRIRKAIILGFVGGFVKPDDVSHPEVLFAMYLQNRYGSAVHVRIYGNHEGTKALEDTIRCLDSNADNHSLAGEKEQIILYGHSWGASQVLSFARELHDSVNLTWPTLII